MLKEFIPPIMLGPLTGLFYGWQGNYSSWEEARKRCTGYDNREIFEKVKSASLKVKTGEAVYERDSVTFDKVHYSFPLLSSLLFAALSNNGKLNVLDFGGSLGSSYFQNKLLLKDLSELNWCVIEQKHFVEEGKRNFADANLSFFYDIESCLQLHKINVALFSSSLQYLENPYSFLDEIISERTEFVIIDRTPFMLSGNDRITIQKVQKNIYRASYPCRIMSERKFLTYMAEKHELIYDFTSSDRMNIRDATIKGYFFRRRDKNRLSSR